MATEKIILSAVDQTRAAFQSVQGNIGRLSSSLKAVSGPLAAAFSVAAVSAYAKSVLNAADNLSKLSQKTGVSVEDLSAFSVAADLAGVNSEQFGSAMVKLNKSIADATGGSKEQIEAFKALGISQQELKNLSPAEALERISDAFAGAEDGAAKTQIAIALLGRSGADLIPLLNGGRESLRKFGTTFSTEFAKNAEQFNDNIRVLSENLTRFSVTVLLPIVKLLNQIFGTPVGEELDKSIEATAAKAAHLQQELARLQEKASGKNLSEKSPLALQIKAIQEQLKLANDELARLQGLKPKDAGAGTQKGQLPSIKKGTEEDKPIEELVERNKKLIDLYNKGLTPIQKYQQALEEIQILNFDGGQELYLENLMRINEEYENAQPKIVRNKTALEEYAEASRNLGQQLDNFAVGALNNLEDALLGVMMGTMSVQDAFKSMATSIISDLMRIYIQRSITGPLADALFGSLPSPGSSSGEPLGTGLKFKAIGGAVQSGSPYMVGERGPEMFIPNASGSIVPNDKLGGSGGGTTVVNLNISTGVAQTVRAEIQSMMPRITEATKAAVADAKRRGGTYGKMMA